MKKITLLFGLCLALFFLSGKVKANTDIYRLYNASTGEHFYTASAGERNSIINAGWSYEGTGWVAPSAGVPVYRVYNPNARGGDHYYTKNKVEAQHLVRLGWHWDNSGRPVFYSGGKTLVYVAYNPHARSGAHNYTTATFEQKSLLSKGWEYGAVAWQAVAAGKSFPSGTVVLPYNPNYKPNSAKITADAVQYIRELRQLNGIKMPISANATMLKYAEADAAVLNKDHKLRDQAAGKKSGENGYSNASSYGYWGSDQETAYMLVKGWFEEWGNIDKATYPYGHRASLLYGGTGMGLGISGIWSSMEFTGQGNWAMWQRINKGASAVDLPKVTFKYVN